MTVRMWIVEGKTGEYEDKTEWIVGLFFSEDKALGKLRDCENFLKENKDKKYDYYNPVKNPFDNKMKNVDPREVVYYIYSIDTSDDIYW